MEYNPAPGHDPALPAVTRRALLGAASALALPLLPLPALAAVREPDPLPDLLAEFQRNRAAWLVAEEETPEAQTLWEAREALGEQIRETVATSPAGLMAQIQYIKEDYNTGTLDSTTLDGLPFDILDTILLGLARIGQ